jgi:hypothetical protein
MAAKPEPTQLEKEQVCVRPSFLCILFFFFFCRYKVRGAIEVVVLWLGRCSG